jgi:hypothetical protein
MIKEPVKSILQPLLSPFRAGNIIMLHLGRCGSTVLSTLLKQHKREIFWASELYVKIFREWEKSNGGEEVVGDMPVDAIDYLKDSMKHALHRYYGFEIKPFHFRLIGFTFENFMRRLEEMEYSHYILLDRENRLRKIISSLIAHEDRNRYHHKETMKVKRKKVYIDVTNVAIDYQSKPLLTFLSDYQVEMTSVSKYFKHKNYLSLTYEKDIQDDPLKGYLRVCDFLGLKPKKVSVKLSRTNPFPVKDMIENFDEVESVLNGTNYEWMLYE